MLIRRFTIVAILIVSLTVKAAMPPQYVELYNLTLLGNLCYFLVGFLLLDLYLLQRDWSMRRNLLWDMISTVGWVGGWTLSVGCKKSHEPTLLCFAIFIAYLGAFRGRIWNLIICNGWLVLLGAMCYTTYLSHSLVIALILNRSVVRFLTFGQNYFFNYCVQLGIFVVVIFAISIPLFLIFERPFMRRDWPARLIGIFWKNQYGARA